MNRPVVLMLGPHRNAVSGISTHLNLLFSSRLADEFSLVHFQVGSEGRDESRVRRLARILASPFCLVAAILVHSAAIVHINTALNARAFWRDLAYLFVARLCGARVLCQVHGGALPQQFFPRGRLATAVLRKTMRLAHAIVVLAQVELEAYRKFFPGQQILACPNGVDVAQYSKIARAHSNTAAPLELVYIGRLTAEKGLYEALRGLHLAHRQGARARIVLAGSGPEEARLRQFAQELGLAADASFVGPVSGADKIRLLTNADVMVLASYSEGLPYALLEGMAAGTTVITTRVGAIPDVVTEGVHGLFVPSRDAGAIARAIGMLAADREALARMGRACRRRIAGGYSMERLSRDLRALYVDICTAGQVNSPARF
ncbi:MAG: glycosyltransferase family 4 protein [Burkholderiales bacterium]